MKRLLLALVALGTLAACSSTAPLGSTPMASAPTGTTGTTTPATTLVIGSQAYYSNEIIAELYAQALEAKGLTVSRQYQIGQRETYLPDLAAGKIDVMPEYSGNLLQYYDKSTT
ncbi:MAG: glycine betaine ABC transporter substrate-binding protein, partial [Propionicimonas sp.]